MHFSSALIVSFLAIGTLAGPLRARDNDHDESGGLKPICPKLPTMERGCVRCMSNPRPKLSSYAQF